MLKVTYLFHSGYWVETDHYHLIFDYVTDNCRKETCLECGRLSDKQLGNGKKKVAFVSHSHCDHFDGSVFQLGEDSSYVISDDVQLAKKDNIIFCKEYDTLQVDGVLVEVFSSTDIGVSFYVQVDGYRIFHAGDLNWWYWEGESKEEKEFAKKGFFAQLERLKGKPVDVAMFPVDPRLEDAYYYGGKEYIETIRPKVFFPMHFQGLYSITSRFCKKMEGTETKIITLSKRGESFEV